MIGVILVHGIGNKFNYPGWSSHLTKSLDKDKYIVKEYLWNAVTQRVEDKLFSELFDHHTLNPIHLLNRYIRKTIFSYAMDASLYDQYKGILINGLERLYDEMSESCDKIILVGYSLGSWICYDFTSTVAPLGLHSFITFGCNIPLHFGYDYKDLGVPWTNIWERDDVLSMPLKKTFIKDIEYKSKNTIFSWNPSAHMCYLVDDKFAKLFKEMCRDEKD